MEGEKRQLQVRVMGACKRSARYAKKWAGATSEWCEMGQDTVLHAMPVRGRCLPFLGIFIGRYRELTRKSTYAILLFIPVNRLLSM